jgi:hypothetical protein
VAILGASLRRQRTAPSMAEPTKSQEMRRT